MCILCVRVKLNKRSFEPFCVWIKKRIAVKGYIVVSFIIGKNESGTQQYRL